MVEKIFNYLNKESLGLHEAAYLLAFFTFLSQILAVLRDRVFASAFGADRLLDMYYASFRIPDFLFITVSSLVSVSVLVPLLIQNDNNIERRKTINSIFTVFLALMFIVMALVFIFMPQLTKLVVPGLHSETLIAMSRTLLLSPLILGVSNLIGGIIQSERRFVSYALSPVMYNLGIIFGGIVLYPILGIMGMVYGVILGSILHVVIQIPTLVKVAIIPRITSSIDWVSVRYIFSKSIPRTLSLAQSHIIMFVSVGIASLLISGSITIYTLAYNLQSVPLAIIGVSYSLAAFPTLARFFKNGEKENFNKELNSAVRHIIFWSLPVIIMFIVLRAQIVRVLFGAGNFDWSDTRLTAAALALFAISVWAQSLNLIFTRAFYAIGRTKEPFYASLIGGIVAIIGCFSLVSILQNSKVLHDSLDSIMKVKNILGSEILALPLAFAVGSIFQSFLLMFMFKRAYCSAKLTGIWLTQSLVASVFMGYVTYFFLNIFDDVFDLDTFFGIFTQGFLSGTFGLVSGVIVLILMKNHEIGVVWQTLHSRIWKSKPITEDPSEVV